MKTKKGELNFTIYLLSFFLFISLGGIIGGISASLTTNYELNTTNEFDNYISSFNSKEFTSDDILNVEASDNDNGEFSIYESSFDFGSNIKNSLNESTNFVRGSVSVLGLPTEVYMIIIGFLAIVIGVLVVFFIRGMKE